MACLRLQQCVAVLRRIWIRAFCAHMEESVMQRTTQNNYSQLWEQKTKHYTVCLETYLPLSVKYNTAILKVFFFVWTIHIVSQIGVMQNSHLKKFSKISCLMRFTSSKKCRMHGQFCKKTLALMCDYFLKLFFNFLMQNLFQPYLHIICKFSRRFVSCLGS